MISQTCNLYHRQISQSRQVCQAAYIFSRSSLSRASNTGTTRGHYTRNVYECFSFNSHNQNYTSLTSCSSASLADFTKPQRSRKKKSKCWPCLRETTKTKQQVGILCCLVLLLFKPTIDQNDLTALG